MNKIHLCNVRSVLVYVADPVPLSLGVDEPLASRFVSTSSFALTMVTQTQMLELNDRVFNYVDVCIVVDANVTCEPG